MSMRWLVIFLLLMAFVSVTQAEAPTSLSAAVYKKLIESQKQLEQDDFDSSVSTLMDLTKRKLHTSYENGMVWHMLGYAYLEKGKLKESAEALEKVLEFDIPQSLNLSNRKLLGQVYMQQSQYRKALPHLNYWLNSSEDDREEIQVLTAQCFYHLQQYKSAVKRINQAITTYKARGKKPQEHWLTLLQSSLAHLDEAEDRIETIKLLLTWYPKPDYWLALAGAYAQLEKMDNYLAVLSLARRKNLLNTESQYLSLASVYFSQQVPIKASQVLQEGLSRGIIRHNVKNLRFLASAFSMAREYEKALNPLLQAANKSMDGKIHMLLGNAYYQLARWQDAADAFEIAIEKGELSQEASTWMLLGQSHLNLKAFGQAAAAFEQAALDEDKAKQAQQWLDYIAYEKNRYQTLGLETN